VLAPKPVERTATAYRFEVNVPANGSQTLKVEQERTTENLTQVFSSTPDFLAVIVENKELSERGKKQLQGVLDLKRRLAANDASLNTAKSQTAELTEDQTRLRQNIDSLNRVKGQEEQVRQYSTQLAGNEAQLAKLRDQGRDLALRSASLNTELRGAIDTLDF
jgi:chromosome segregation ATPase